jgi:hypothetical protein
VLLQRVRDKVNTAGQHQASDDGACQRSPNKDWPSYEETLGGTEEESGGLMWLHSKWI